MPFKQMNVGIYIDRMIHAEPKPALIPGFPFDGIGDHLIDHRLAFTEMN